MARIVVGSYVVRFPLGGYLSWVSQWLHGLDLLGHDVYLVEKAGWRDACFDPRAGEMGDDCTYGTDVVNDLLDRLGLHGRWCFVNADGRHFGLTEGAVRDVFSSADLLIDMGAHGTWNAEADGCMTVLVDGEPAFTQMKMEAALTAGEALPAYDRYYTVGRNVGTERSSAPTGGRRWRPIFNPVALDLFDVRRPEPRPPYTTVMSWRAHRPIEHRGRTYGQKDVEFERFVELPRLTDVALEVSVSGPGVPGERLRAGGWHVRDAHETAVSFDAYRDYIAGSRGELSVCKNVFVDTWSGWFSDRSACYLASGRPVMLQDTGWSEHLPTGEGLFAVRTAGDAAAAIEEIELDYERHSKAARRIAEEHLATDVVLRRLLEEIEVR
jgi:hypothetical protein